MDALRIEMQGIVNLSFYVAVGLTVLVVLAVRAVDRGAGAGRAGRAVLGALWGAVLVAAVAKLGVALTLFADRSGGLLGRWGWFAEARTVPLHLTMAANGVALLGALVLLVVASAVRRRRARAWLDDNELMKWFDESHPIVRNRLPIPAKHIAVETGDQNPRFHRQRLQGKDPTVVMREHWHGRLRYFRRNGERRAGFDMRVWFDLIDTDVFMLDCLLAFLELLGREKVVTEEGLGLMLRDHVQKGLAAWFGEIDAMKEFAGTGRVSKLDTESKIRQLAEHWVSRIDPSPDPVVTPDERPGLIRSTLGTHIAACVRGCRPWQYYDVAVEVADGVPSLVAPGQPELLTPMVRVDHGGSRFLMDTFPVTVAEYAEFLASGRGAASRHTPANWSGQMSLDKGDHPVVGVSWHDARAYAAWAKKRLPTNVEWQRAARGEDPTRAYPWEGEFDASKCNCEDNLPIRKRNFSTTPVCMFPDSKSPCGCFDMAGNVLEWCEDARGADTALRLVKGGSWRTSGKCAQRTRIDFDHHFASGTSADYIGFRCCR